MGLVLFPDESVNSSTTDELSLSQVERGKVQFLIQNEREEPDDEVKDLPSLKSSNFSFRIISILREDSFGKVIKVQERTSKKIYAMKIICMSMGQSPNSNQVSKKSNFSNSAMDEWKLLPRLRHQNIIRYIDSFLIPKDPLLKQGGSTHLALLMEHISGTTLDSILEFYENNNIYIQHDETLKWFLKLLDALNFSHSMNIIHGGLKTDNIYVYQKETNEFSGRKKKINLKITDFGVSSGRRSENPVRNSVGNSFFSSPESLSGKDTGSKEDSWGLGIVLFQVLKTMSIKSYTKILMDLCEKIQKNEKITIKFLNYFKLEELNESVTYGMIMEFIHAEHMLVDTFFHELAFQREDEAIIKILQKMLCPIQDRLTLKEISNLKAVRTWKFLLNEENEIITNVDFIDLRSLFTMIKNIPYTKQIVWNNCLYCFKMMISSKKRKIILSGKNLLTLFSNAVIFKENPVLTIKFFRLLYLICMNNEENIRLISIYLRTFGMIKTLKKVISTGKNTEIQDIFYLTFLMIKNNNTIRVLFKNALSSLFRRYSVEYDVILYHIIESLMPLVEKSKDITYYLEIYEKNDISFIKNCDLRFFHKQKKTILKEILQRILKRLTELNKEKVPDGMRKEVDYMMRENLIMLLFFLLKPGRKVHKLKIKNYQKKNIKNKINYLRVLREGNNTELNKNLDEFKCIDGNIDSYTELISHNPICKFEGRTEEEYVVGSFELYVCDGGNNDNIQIGIYVSDRKYILLNCCQGVIQISHVDQENRMEDLLLKYKKIYAMTDTYIGCSVSSHGNLFFSKGNKIISPFIRIDKTGIRKGDRIRAVFRICGNEHFRGIVNFGGMPFKVNYKNQKKKEKTTLVRKKLRAVMKGLDYSILKDLQKKFGHISFYRRVLQKIIGCCEKKGKKGKKFFSIRDPDLIKRYRYDKSFERISKSTGKFLQNRKSQNETLEVGVVIRSFKNELNFCVRDKKKIFKRFLIENCPNLEKVIESIKENGRNIQNPNENVSTEENNKNEENKIFTEEEIKIINIFEKLKEKNQKRSKLKKRIDSIRKSLDSIRGEVLPVLKRSNSLMIKVNSVKEKKKENMMKRKSFLLEGDDDESRSSFIDVDENCATVVRNSFIVNNEEGEDDDDDDIDLKLTSFNSLPYHEEEIGENMENFEMQSDDDDNFFNAETIKSYLKNSYEKDEEEKEEEWEGGEDEEEIVKYNDKYYIDEGEGYERKTVMIEDFDNTENSARNTENLELESEEQGEDINLENAMTNYESILNDYESFVEKQKQEKILEMNETVGGETNHDTFMNQEEKGKDAQNFHNILENSFSEKDESINYTQNGNDEEAVEIEENQKVEEYVKEDTPVDVNYEAFEVAEENEEVRENEENVSGVVEEIEEAVEVAEENKRPMEEIEEAMGVVEENEEAVEVVEENEEVAEKETLVEDSSEVKEEKNPQVEENTDYYDNTVGNDYTAEEVDPETEYEQYEQYDHYNEEDIREYDNFYSSNNAENYDQQYYAEGEEYTDSKNGGNINNYDENQVWDDYEQEQYEEEYDENTEQDNSEWVGDENVNENKKKNNIFTQDGFYYSQQWNYDIGYEEKKEKKEGKKKEIIFVRKKKVKKEKEEEEEGEEGEEEEEEEKEIIITKKKTPPPVPKRERRIKKSIIQDKMKNYVGNQVGKRNYYDNENEYRPPLPVKSKENSDYFTQKKSDPPPVPVRRKTQFISSEKLKKKRRPSSYRLFKERSKKKEKTKKFSWRKSLNLFKK